MAIHQSDRNNGVTWGSQYRPGYGSGKPTWNTPGFTKPAPPTNRAEGNGNHPYSLLKLTPSSTG